MDSLLGSIQRIPRKAGLSSGTIGVLLGITILCLGGFLFSYTASIDDELTLINRNQSILFHFQIGRFMLGLLRLGAWQSTHPFIAYASLAVAYVTSYALLLGIHNLRHSWTTTLSFVIFIGFPTNWLLQEFPVTAFSLAFGLVLAPLAAIETLRVHAGDSGGRAYNWRLSLITVALLVVMIGFFQSFVLLYLSIGVGCVLLDGDAAREETSLRLRALPYFVGYGVIATLLHRLLFKLSLLIQNLEPTHLDQYTRNTLGLLRFKPLDYLSGHAVQIIRSYAHPGYSYGPDLWALPILIAGSILTYGFATRRSQHLSPLTQAGLVGLLLLSPFLLNLLSTPNRLPLRSYVSFPYVIWVFSMLWLFHARRLRRGAVLAAALGTGLLSFQCLNVISEYSFARNYHSRADFITASSIASAMLNRPEFSGQGPLKLVVQGELERPLLSRSAWYSSANGSFFNWDGGSPGRIVAYLRTLGIANLRVGDAATRARVNSQFRTMRSWPDPQSLRLRGDVLLLKLSDDSRPLKAS
ncbi:glucosyltransferase domain-containing protein [Synechococcus sp. BA-132 BA5]|uniref:glucosyltransferase domain-containing protein n=1 Tax=Synechococcus sp. BA-132 BA5 TaxID=3110252 RepID=UPI002B214612|nr:glucosyltransferase domain-containing protein [Synechococcus sp. BA-132 BA5]MEA5414628.1 glucosyltransferase domain-containing protein [Synechococcus sp. BA-132 BA5]